MVSRKISRNQSTSQGTGTLLLASLRRCSRHRGTIQWDWMIRLKKWVVGVEKWNYCNYCRSTGETAGHSFVESMEVRNRDTFQFSKRKKPQPLRPRTSRPTTERRSWALPCPACWRRPLATIEITMDTMGFPNPTDLSQKTRGAQKNLRNGLLNIIFPVRIPRNLGSTRHAMHKPKLLNQILRVLCSTPPSDD
jgi:hypothetical protein